MSVSLATSAPLADVVVSPGPGEPISVAAAAAIGEPMLALLDTMGGGRTTPPSATTTTATTSSSDAAPTAHADSTPPRSSTTIKRVRTQEEEHERIESEYMPPPTPSSSVVPAPAGAGDKHFSCAHVLTGHTGYVCALTTTSDGKLVSGSRDNSLRVWTLPASASSSSTSPGNSSSSSSNNNNSPALYRELLDVHANRVWALVTVTDELGEEKAISGSWDSTVNVYNIKTWEIEKKLAAHDAWIMCAAVVGKKHFVTCSADCTIRVWSVAGFQPERVLRHHRDTVYALAWSPAHNMLFSGDARGNILCWETTHWRFVRALDKRPERNPGAGETPVEIRVLCWCPQTEFLVSGGSDGVLCSYSKADVTASRRTDMVVAHGEGVEAVVELSNGRVASGSRDCSIGVWDLLRGLRCLQLIEAAHSHWVYALVWDASGGRLMSSSCDMKIKVWEERNVVVGAADQARA